MFSYVRRMQRAVTCCMLQFDAAVTNMVSELHLDEEILCLEKRLKIGAKNIEKTSTYTWKRELESGKSFSSVKEQNVNQNILANLSFYHWSQLDDKPLMMYSTRATLPSFVKKVLLLHLAMVLPKQEWKEVGEEREHARTQP